MNDKIFKLSGLFLFILRKMLKPMTKVKVFRVEGEYTKNHQKYVFRKEKRALTKEDAIELVLSEITSIGIYRRQVSKLAD